jgi:hypothetical protein
MSWPHPGDSPVVIARRVAWAYRARLEKANPADCRDLDRIMSKLGQHWAVARPVTRRPDEWVPAREAAEIAAVSIDTIRNLRLAGRLTGRQVSERQWEYQVANVIALSAAPRTRKRNPDQPRE